MEPSRGPPRGPVWGPALNCSAGCGGRGCSPPPGIHSQEAWEILQQLCSLSSAGVEAGRRAISPVLCAVVWTLLSSGILLALIFLVFTLRFRNNRIVKMSSPNLNILTLFGSVLTYSSGFLFAIEERAPEPSPRAAMQARIWILCIGSSLVFGPILGKTWRIYRVFTQRVPDRRVIIRDLQLMGLVVLLILLDLLVLTVWGLTDPVQCAGSISAVVKVVGREVSYSLTQLDSCSSLHSDIWILLFCVLKGSVLLYGTYLAGLTSDVSSPPVNQSPTIMAAVCLASLSAAVAVPVSRLLQDWPNVVYGVVSGAIFLCTLAVDCLLFVPQLTQWKRFEDELNPHPSQMAKYFSTPSRSLRSMYSEDEVYCRENNAMKRLLTEKNALIDSLQEQVNNAKEKLLRLMVVSGPPGPDRDREMDSSNTNLHSSSTQVTELPPETSGPLLDDLPPASPPPLPPTRTEEVPHSAERGREFASEGLGCDTEATQAQLRTTTGPSGSSGGVDTTVTDPPEAAAPSGDDVVSGRAPRSPPPLGADRPGSAGALGERTLAVLAGGKPGFVSSEQLQEVLQELCVDASLRSPTQGKRAHDEHRPGSSGSPVDYLYPSISPYVMRKRRPPFRNSRAGPPPYCYPGSERPIRGSVASCGGAPETVPTETPLHPADTGTVDEEEQEREGESLGEDVPLRRGSRWDHRRPTRRSTVPPFARSHPKRPRMEGARGSPPGPRDPYDYSDSDSSSSEDSYCFYHRPYCSVCLQGPYGSVDSTGTESSDSEPGRLPGRGRRTHPVVNFNDDLKPTFV
ncbi:probable G-protein coupled receptor 156 [Conger conger]|uniref:probable G-protein coupled receptor 156 n=1 Tax=Conger conger TaxID=82655 RepID=UPI002A5ADA09|nr:probable G-protein coupled receptor 156 [Conger conger]